MRGSSSTPPAQVVQSKGGHQFRTNIEEVERLVEGEPPVVEWQYDYVNVPDLNRQTLVDALITDKFSYASQLGKLALDRESQEWLDYQAYREACILAVDTALA